jgi:AraC-like DNA-binding protein
MTTKHLHRICLACTGKSTSQLIAERLMLEAKRKLVSDSKSIQEIADELGFENYPYFHLFFKKHAGETPKEFRDRGT